jgi:fatty acid desaturase
MKSEKMPPKISWYRSPVRRDQLQVLNERSDLKGFAQTGGFLGLIALTGTAACLSAGRYPWAVTVLLLFVHGTCWSFLIHGIHELVHSSVFKTKRYNTYFLRIFAFLAWFNHHRFWASHTEHHKYTLHPPDDMEVLLPVRLTLKEFFLRSFINPIGLWNTVSGTVMMARGKLQREWDKNLFADADPAELRRMSNWARILLAGHSLIIVVSIAMRWWLLPVVTTFAPFYGSWLCYFCNNTQHAGLQDNVPDYRLCSRTFTVNPVVGFLYWHMNYHTEHHMYAAVPCYNLTKLHELIKSDLPECPHGLVSVWKQIIATLKQQKKDPAYRYVPELPVGSHTRAAE